MDLQSLVFKRISCRSLTTKVYTCEVRRAPDLGDTMPGDYAPASHEVSSHQVAAVTMIGHVDAVVVGAGVVGLSVARALASRGREVLVLERLPRAGEETSARNSGVIHSGIYYAPGSLKARLCVRGRELLYEFCAQRGVAHRRCGKLIVAQAGQVDALHSLGQRAKSNGVPDLAWLTSAEARQLEPAVSCAAALFSPSTGILDVQDYVRCLLGDLESLGGAVVFRAAVERASHGGGGFQLQVQTPDGGVELQCGLLVNSAGLGAVRLAAALPGRRRELPTAHFAKGTYFGCRGPSPFRHLVYPMPNEAGLGVHATLDMAGRVRFGPDVEWVPHPDYLVSATRLAGFQQAIRAYWPALPDDALWPDYAGVRPKIVGPGEPAADFLVEGPARHGIRGMVNLMGIESPGLTSCLAIAEHVATLLDESD